jgi:hypothetical protein
MSRNFELLQRLKRTTTGQSSLPPLDRVEGEPFLERTEFAAAVAPGAKLPCAELDPSEKRELVKLTNTLFRIGDFGAPRLIAITGIDENASAARIAACVGELLADLVHGPVCIANADERNGGLLAQQFGVDTGIDPRPVLLRDVSIRTDDQNPWVRLWILSDALRADGNGVPTQQRLYNRVQQLRGEYAYCLLIVPPVSASPDVLVLGPAVDGALLVIDAQTTRREAAIAAKDIFEKARLPLLGAVLTNRKYPIPEWLYQRL